MTITKPAALVTLIGLMIGVFAFAANPTPVISSISPNPAVRGVTRLTITGTNLTNQVRFYDGAGLRYSEVGSVNAAKTQTTILVPAVLPVGNATVKIYYNGVDSKGKLLKINDSSGSPTTPTPTPASPPTTVGPEKNLGEGVFPDVAWKDGKLWLAVKQGDKVNLYSSKPDLSDIAIVKDFTIPNPDNSFPRLTVSNNVLWLAYRDGTNIQLWRSDTGATENLGGGWGNDPVALGNGFVVWQSLSDKKVKRRALTGGTVTTVQAALPTGINRVLPSGSIVTIDQTIYSSAYKVSFGTKPWVAGALTVAEGLSSGDTGRFNNQASTQFDVFSGVANTPHAAFDGTDLYAVATWGGPGVRVQVGRWAGSSTPPSTPNPSPATPDGETPPVCDPLPDDPELILECNFWDITHPRPKTYDPGFDPGNPTVLTMEGTHGVEVAYNSKNHTTMVVAQAYGLSGNPDHSGVKAIVLDSATLKPVGTEFRIDRAGGGAPKVAYNPDQDQFLVAWADYSASIHGRLVSGEGQLIGNDFLITGSGGLREASYDRSNKRYVLVLDDNSAVVLKLIDPTGSPGQEIRLKNEGSAIYEGQGNLAFNSALNQYWIAYVRCIDVIKNGKSIPDCQERLERVDAKTMKQVGETLLITAPVPAGIAYDSDTNSTMVVWQDLNGSDGRGVYGLTISNDLKLSGVFPVLTPITTSYGGELGGASIKYNSQTKTFFVSGYADYSVVVAEVDPSGLVYGWNEVLAPPSVTFAPPGNSWINKLLAINWASAAAYGNYNSTFDVTDFGTTSAASQNYARVVVSNNLSSNAGNALAAEPGDNAVARAAIPPVILSPLAKLINQIYVWSLGVAALLALLMTVIGGYYYMTAHGNAEQSSKGVDMIWGSVIGLALLFGSYLILRTINPDLVNFGSTPTATSVGQQQADPANAAPRQ